MGFLWRLFLFVDDLFLDDAGETIFETERDANVAVLQPPAEAYWLSRTFANASLTLPDVGCGDIEIRVVGWRRWRWRSRNPRFRPPKSAGAFSGARSTCVAATGSPTAASFPARSSICLRAGWPCWRQASAMSAIA